MHKVNRNRGGMDKRLTAFCSSHQRLTITKPPGRLLFQGRKITNNCVGCATHAVNVAWDGEEGRGPPARALVDTR